MKLNRVLLPAVLLLSTAAWTGCDLDDGWEPRQADAELQEIARKLEARAQSLAVLDTVSSVAYLQGTQPIRVEGYGIVVGLGRNGSAECPPDVRNRLIHEMRKRQNLRSRSKGLGEFRPNELLEDSDTAVVRIAANIPGAALRGTPMDASITALPGTQTRSLQGGYLWRCDLKRFRVGNRATVIHGKTLAYAEGPVFVNPFDPEGQPRKEPNPRVGTLLGTARVLVDREIRLEIREPSFRIAVLLARKINERFPGPTKVANATSPGTVEMKIPPEYAGREDRFAALMMHVYLKETPGFLDRRTRELAAEILDIDAPHDDIGLAWEAIGKRTLPEIRKLYTDRRLHVSFFAARTGLRMNDTDAVLVLRRHAHDLRSPHQREAIRELGRADNITAAADALRPLLNHDDDRVRIQAYLALRDRMDRFIAPQRIGEPNFVLDRVRSTGKPLIYGRVAGSQRLAVFGDQTLCDPPIFYEHADRLFGLHALDNADTITILRLGTDGQMIASPIQAPLEVAGLVARLGREPIRQTGDELAGANVPYSEVLRCLYDLAAAGSIDARFELETPRDRTRTGPLEPPGRPETDLED